ncbi:FAD dependent oxidoreductase [Dipodascopsis tothii]|uniref:FAD dependent oxidoreductase n=1 Tax=Dipodascopsis tothii TaxID=44089 RepID=UPI0034CE7C74
MATLIVGGGIIGLSTAYYLSETQDVVVVDTAPELFRCASGRSGGYMSRLWYGPEVAPLGKLSFRLHAEAAAAHDGAAAWGYRRTTAWSIKSAGRRPETEYAEERLPKDGAMPPWVFGDPAESYVLDGEDDCAQVNPRLLCEHLYRTCVARGVRIIHPCVVESVAGTKAVRSATLRHLVTGAAETVSIGAVVFATGAWTADAFKRALPAASYTPPVSALAGFALVLSSPRVPYVGTDAPVDPDAHPSTDVAYYLDAPAPSAEPQASAIDVTQALFVRPAAGESWSPEIFLRANGEIFYAGLNEASYEPPVIARPAPAYTKDPLASSRQSATFASALAAMTEAAIIAPGRNKFDAVLESARNLLGPDVSVLRRSVCVRPVTPSGDPIIGLVPPERAAGLANVYVCAGHGPWGISLSLGTGRVMADIVTGQPVSADVSALAP